LQASWRTSQQQRRFQADFFCVIEFTLTIYAHQCHVMQLVFIMRQMPAEAVTTDETPPLAKRKRSYCSSSTASSHKQSKKASTTKQSNEQHSSVSLPPLLAIAKTGAALIWLHMCDLQSGFFRSGWFRQKIAGKTADEPTLMFQLLTLKKLESYMKGQGPNQRREPSYSIALSGISSTAEFDASSSRVTYAMTHADGSATDYMECDLSLEHVASTSSYSLSVIPHAGGHARLATALRAVPSNMRRGKIYGHIKLGNTLYHLSEPFVTGSYSTGTPAKAAVHTFVGKAAAVVV
jgi:hypothetical protein